MSPETEANDHVPLEFLLGARVKNYYPDTSTAAGQGRSSKAKRIFASSIHPRRREEQARRLLQQVLDQEDSRVRERPPESAILPADSDRKALLRALADAKPTSRLDQETIFDDDSFQLSFDETRRSCASIKTLQQLRDDDLKRKHQRATSFHGYEQDSGSFLDVTGAAARIPQTTTRQLRELKASLVNSKKKLEDKRTRELLGLLQEQQQFTRTALKQHKQLASKRQQQKHPRVVSTSLLTLDNVEKRDNGNNSLEENQISPKARTVAPLQLNETWYESEELMHPRRPALATLHFDSRVFGASLLPKLDESSEDSISYNEEETPGADDDGELIRKRLGDRQREEFASSAANGLFLGGGFIAKKTSGKYEKNTNHSINRAASDAECLETVLGTQSASILPLAEANKPALRRRAANAGRRRRISRHQPPPDK